MPSAPSLRGTLIACLLSLWSTAALAQGNWWEPAIRCRVAVTVDPDGFTRQDRPVEVELELTTLLNTAGLGGPVSVDSLRVVDATAEQLVPFQFDPAADFDAATTGHGTVVFIAEGTLTAPHHYDIYFDSVVATPISFADQVAATAGVAYAGQNSIHVVTPRATYYLHEQGGGFASILDEDGNDWISFDPTPGSGSAGEYRGIPNLGVWAHPGYTDGGGGGELGSVSAILLDGPIKVTLQITTSDNASQKIWEIFPAFARMTLLRSGGNYWFLYEGTPGGSLDANDYCVRSPGTQTDINTAWHADLPDPEWVYFGDSGIDRVIFLVHHEDDDHVDQFWQMQDNMTVLGFGREYTCCTRYMSDVPAHFTIGLADAADQSTAIGHLNAAYRPLGLTVAEPEVYPPADADGAPPEGDGAPPGGDAVLPSGDSALPPGDTTASAGDLSGSGSDTDISGFTGDAMGAPLVTGCRCGAQAGGVVPVAMLLAVLRRRRRPRSVG